MKQLDWGDILMNAMDKEKIYKRMRFSIVPWRTSVW
jgi:hypothetical protein